MSAIGLLRHMTVTLSMCATERLVHFNGSMYIHAYNVHCIQDLMILDHCFLGVLDFLDVYILKILSRFNPFEPAGIYASRRLQCAYVRKVCINRNFIDRFFLFFARDFSIA